MDIIVKDSLELLIFYNFKFMIRFSNFPPVLAFHMLAQKYEFFPFTTRETVFVLETEKYSMRTKKKHFNERTPAAHVAN